MLVAAGRDPGRFEGAVNAPVFRASTVLSPSWGDWLDKKARQKEGEPGFYYGRVGTPTSQALLEAVAAIEGGTAAYAYPSGLAACAGAILALAGSGDHVLMVDTVYGPVRRLAGGLLKRMGIETTFFDPRAGGAVEELFRPNTRVVYVESPGSQSMEVMDIPAIAAVARKHDAHTILDNTWAALTFFSPFDKGVDVSVHAATKYIVGHSDAVVGLAIVNERANAAVRTTALDLGQTVSPDDAFLALRGLRTLSVRLARHQTNGLALAEWLDQQPEVSVVNHPALKTSVDHDLWRRDFTGASGLFSFELKPKLVPALGAFMDALEHFCVGASWGGYESLVLPARTVRTAPGAVSRDLIRIHAGLEDTSDLLDDLKAGLLALRRAVEK